MWLAEQDGAGDFKRRVALKVLRGGAREDEQTQQLLKEARLCANLSHPHIVDILSISDEGGTLHVAMEYVDGGTLHDLVNRALACRVALPNSVVVGLLADIAAGLAYGHDARGEDGEPLRIVHRDMKLGNVLIDKIGGVAKVADFGMAKAAGDMTMTATGFVKGTPAYVAPEVWEGSREFSSAVDLFAVGCIAFALVTRRRLFDGENVASIYGQICKRSPAEEAAAIAERFPALAPVAEKLLQRDPVDRYNTAQELLGDLDIVRDRTPAVSDLRGFLWLLDRIEGENTADEEPPFPVPPRADSGWANALRVATGDELEIVPDPPAIPLPSGAGSGPAEVPHHAGAVGVAMTTVERERPVQLGLKPPSSSAVAPVVATPRGPETMGSPAPPAKSSRSPWPILLAGAGAVAAAVAAFFVLPGDEARTDPGSDPTHLVEASDGPATATPVPDIEIVREATPVPEPSAAPASTPTPRPAAPPLPEEDGDGIAGEGEGGGIARAASIKPLAALAGAVESTPAEVEAAPTLGCLSLTSKPPGAKVWLKGVLSKRRAPFSIERAAGLLSVGMGISKEPKAEVRVGIEAGAGVAVHCDMGEGTCVIRPGDPTACD